MSIELGKNELALVSVHDGDDDQFELEAATDGGSDSGTDVQSDESASVENSTSDGEVEAVEDEQAEPGNDVADNAYSEMVREGPRRK